MGALPSDLLRGVENAAALRRMVGALGYPVWYGTIEPVQEMEWATNAAVELQGRAFEVLARTEDGLLWLLLPPRQGAENRLTLATQRRLFGSLEGRTQAGLLVLPDPDWRRLTLLLLDTPPADPKSTDFLTVNLTLGEALEVLPHTSRRALEMLDISALPPLADVREKVMGAFRRAQQELLFRNQGFFSTYYLESRIHDDGKVGEVWQGWEPELAALGESLRPLLAALTEETPRQVLEALGWTMTPATGADKGLFTLAQGGEAVALLALLPGAEPLESRADSQSPHLRLIAALEQRRQAATGRLQWGVLTNGREWRLISTLASSLSGVYYELDLVDLLDFGTEKEWRYFVAFFAPRGLRGQGTTRPFAEQVYRASQMLAKRVGEDLKKLVFEEVFDELASGIADSLQRQGRYTGDEAQRRLIFRATLILLYRLLFLLYAESRRLLPTVHPAFYPHSLTFLLTEIVVRPFLPEARRLPLGPTAEWIWNRLTELFQAVNEGNKDWRVPRYNGGLFRDGGAASDPTDPKAPYRLLAEVQVGALYLHKALDWLGRDPAARGATEIEEARRLIDYAALDVRRLGSIYEGLLEYQLVEEQGGETVTLRLENDKGERRATGSYYTPDYIVQYIVEQAVGPVLEERRLRLAERMSELAATRTQWERYERQQYAGRSDLKQKVREAEQRAMEALLDIKVLDPAMGSGHFLVATVDFLTDRLITLLHPYPDNPIVPHLQTIRADIRASLDEQGIGAEFISAEQLSDARLLRRLVMKRCVYGVDLNDMAVELARLSLWLHSFTVGAPLSFLDHHLKWGNSLIGARVQAVQTAMEEGKQTTLKGGEVVTQSSLIAWGSAFAEVLNTTSLLKTLVQLADANRQQVEESERLYREVEKISLPTKRVLDLWTSQFFGSEESKFATSLVGTYHGRKEVKKLMEVLLGTNSLALGDKHARAVDYTRAMFQQHRFLHWDLEFPEVFIDQTESKWKPAEEAGFDAVVGNPPYVDSEEMTRSAPELRTYCVKQWKSAQGNWDLFVIFVDLGLIMTRPQGYSGMIVPNKLLGAEYAQAIQAKLKRVKLQSIHDYSKVKVFEANVYPIVLVVQAAQPEPGHTVEMAEMAQDNQELPVVTRITQTEQSILDKLPLGYWSPLFSNNLSILAKCLIGGTNLGTLAEVLGAATVSEAYELVHVLEDDGGDEQGASLRFINTGTIDRYEMLWGQSETQYLKASYKYPIVRDSKLRRLFPTRYNQAKTAKIILAGMVKQLEACYDDGMALAGKSTVIVLSNQLNLHFLLALLNSKVYALIYREIYEALALQGGFIRVGPPQVEKLPIRRIPFTTPTPRREELAEEGRALYEAGLGMASPAALLAFVAERLAQEPEEADVVHDLLAHLAQRMIALNQHKQAEAGRFLAWLEAESGSPVETWSGKSFFQRYWEQQWGTLETTLQKNRGKFPALTGLRGKAADPALAPLLDATRRQWLASVQALAPTLAALAHTDRLIDEIVYRLYGLTEEEVRVVEGEGVRE